MWRRLFASAVALSCLLLAGCPPPPGAQGSADPNAIRIGAYFPDTGVNAAGGKMTREGIDLAIKLRPEVGGHPISLVYADNRSDKAESANAVSRLIEKEEAVAILGTYSSSNAIAGSEVCEAAGAPMLSPSATNPIVTDGKRFAFRACFIDPFQGRVLAKYAHEHLGAKSALIVQDVANDYSVGLSSFFKSAFEDVAGAGSVKRVISYQQGDQDFTAQLTAAKGEAVDVIFIPGYFGDIALFARQARELGVTSRILAGDAAQADELITIGGEAVEGLILSNHYAPEESSSAAGQAFVEEFRKAYGKPPNAFGALGFDSYNMLLDAIERALRAREKGLTEFRAAIRDELAKTKGFPGVTGTITIDANGDATKSAVLLEVKEGRFSYLLTLAP